jgi:hypothetical protein
MTLLIEDLPLEDEMDCTAMTHVHGGRLPQVMVDLIIRVDEYTHPPTSAPPPGMFLPVPGGSI